MNNINKHNYQQETQDLQEVNMKGETDTRVKTLPTSPPPRKKFLVNQEEEQLCFVPEYTSVYGDNISEEKQELIYSPSLAWECPRCHRINAPFTAQCSCTQEDIKSNSNRISFKDIKKITKPVVDENQIDILEAIEQASQSSERVKPETTSTLSARKDTKENFNRIILADGGGENRYKGWKIKFDKKQEKSNQLLSHQDTEETSTKIHSEGDFYYG